MWTLTAQKLTLFSQLQYSQCFQRAAAADENWTERRLGLLKFNYGFAQNLAQDSPKQAKNEIIQEIASFQLVPLFIVRFAPVSS